MERKQLTAGQKYRVTKAGAYLAYEIPHYGYSECRSLKLSEGDVIEYVRNAYGGGSDDVYYDYFLSGDKKGKFWPNNWGICDASYLEPV
jgi:hypothetical protein